MESRVLLHYNKFYLFIKNTKKGSLASDWWECTNFCLKENARAFSKNSITQAIITILGVKKRLSNFLQEENFKP